MNSETAEQREAILRETLSKANTPTAKYIPAPETKQDQIPLVKLEDTDSQAANLLLLKIFPKLAPGPL